MPIPPCPQGREPWAKHDLPRHGRIGIGGPMDLEHVLGERRNAMTLTEWEADCVGLDDGRVGAGGPLDGDGTAVGGEQDRVGLAGKSESWATIRHGARPRTRVIGQGTEGQQARLDVSVR